MKRLNRYLTTKTNYWTQDHPCFPWRMSKRSCCNETDFEISELLNHGRHPLHRLGPRNSQVLSDGKLSNFCQI